MLEQQNDIQVMLKTSVSPVFICDARLKKIILTRGSRRTRGGITPLYFLLSFLRVPRAPL